MKTILCIVLLTVVYVVAMTKFTDQQDYLNASLFASLENQYNTSINFGDDFYEDIDEYQKISVTFSGQISSKKKISVYYGTTLEEAIQLAGGLLANADLNALNLSYLILEETTFYIPKTSAESKVSINSGTLDELDSLPSIGKISATNIINYREENGPFMRIEDLKKVSGIGTATFEKIKDYIIL